MAGANDLIVLFLGLESLSIALYVLIALAGRRASARESAMKYFVLGAFSSAFFLYGIALVYGATGGTNLSGISEFLFGTVRDNDYLLLAGVALLLVGLGFKIAAVPFHFWAPDVYEGAPEPGHRLPRVDRQGRGLRGAGAGAVRGGRSRAGHRWRSRRWSPIIVALAYSFASLSVGAVMAICQSDVKRMLAFSLRSATPASSCVGLAAIDPQANHLVSRPALGAFTVLPQLDGGWCRRSRADGQSRPGRLLPRRLLVVVHGAGQLRRAVGSCRIVDRSR